MVERRAKQVRPHGLSPAAISRWNLGGFLLGLVVGSVTLLSSGPLMDVLRNVFIVLLAYWIVFASVSSLVARWQARRARMADRRVWASRAVSGGVSRPWHPAQGPPLETGVKSMHPYQLGPELPSLN